HRLVPGGEVALRVPFAAVERSALARAALHDLAFLALWALHADLRQKRARVPALREAAAGHELAEFAEFDHHRPTALFAVLAGRLILQLHPLHRLLGGGERIG